MLAETFAETVRRTGRIPKNPDTWKKCGIDTVVYVRRTGHYVPWFIFRDASAYSKGEAFAHGTWEAELV